MLSNSQFYEEWKPKHKQGILAYILPDILRGVIILALGTLVIFLIHRPVNPDNTRWVILNNISLVLIWTICKVCSWFKEEKRFKEIRAVIEEVYGGKGGEKYGDSRGAS